MPTFTRLDVKVLVSVLLEVVFAWMIPRLSVLSAAFAALLCVQEAHKGPSKAGLNRLLATSIGGALGVLVAMVATAWSSKALTFMALALAISLTLWLSKIVKLLPFISRIAVLTLLLVVFVGQGQSFNYIVERLIATLFGALIAWGVSAGFSKW